MQDVTEGRFGAEMLDTPGTVGKLPFGQGEVGVGVAGGRYHVVAVGLHLGR